MHVFRGKHSRHILLKSAQYSLNTTAKNSGTVIRVSQILPGNTKSMWHRTISRDDVWDLHCGHYLAVLLVPETQSD